MIQKTNARGQKHSADPNRGLQLAAIEHLFVGMTNSAQLAEEGGPLILEGGEGVWITDDKGRRFIDAISGFYCKNTGHGREEIARAVYEQLCDVSMNVFTASTAPTILLAARLAELTPGSLSRTFFTSGGSESNETALKMAQQFHARNGQRGRYKVISRRGSYHGATYGTMWLGDHLGYPRHDFQPIPPHVVHAPNPDPSRCELGGSTPEECAELCAAAIEKLILFHGPESVSAVIGEPVSQPMGGVIPGPGYWDRVREICDRYGVLLIFDEVITGFGRLGTWFGAEIAGVTPDIMTFAKGITSGYFPMGGAIASKEIGDTFSGGPEATFKHMFTYTGHPAGAAAALKNLDILERDDLVENARHRGEQLRGRLLAMKGRHPIIREVRGLGLLQGIEFVAKDNMASKNLSALADLSNRLTPKLADRGVWVRVQRFGVLPIAPPLSISPGEIDQMADAIEESINELESEFSEI